MRIGTDGSRSDGFRMNALPQAMAGAQRDHGGEIERRDAGDDAERLADREQVDAGTGALGIFALHQVRNATGKFDDFEAALNVALGIGKGLAVLGGQQAGEIVIFALDQLQEPEHDAGSALRIGGGPGREGGREAPDTVLPPMKWPISRIDFLPRRPNGIAAS
jgi:hypothetical protein